MLPRAAGFAIPWQLAEKHGIRRFGFHGLAHQWMWERFAQLSPERARSGRVITLQLGHGCSAAAVLRGRSLDVTMGFTPLEGLMMDTRSGDVDPALVAFLVEREGIDAHAVEHMLNTRSGLLGVSGTSSDLRDLLAAEERDERAHLAVEMFCHRIQKSIGALQAVLEGVDAIVFSGGIGDNSVAVRARTVGALEWCGVHLDGGRNAAADAGDRRISTPASGVEVWVIPAEEELLIARAVIERAGANQSARPKESSMHKKSPTDGS
jgi:acetate kinase